MQKNTSLRLLLFFLFLLIIFLSIDVKDFFGRAVLTQLNVHYFLPYFITYFGLVFSSCTFLLAKNKIIWYSAIALLFISLVISISSKLIIYEGFSVDEASIIIEEAQWGGGLARVYLLQFLEAITISLLIVIIIVYLRFKWIKTRTGKKPILYSSIFIVLQILIIFRTQSLIAVFPCFFNVPAISLYTYVDIFLPRHHSGARNAPKITPARKGMAKHIILLVDESVRGDALTINNKEIPTTPFLEKIIGSYYNYGIACSAANLSIGSNMILQSGLKINQIPDHNFCWATNPSLFQYAKKAGYQTSYIDGQMRYKHPQNGMTLSDFIPIDKYIQVLDMKHYSDYESDCRTIDFLDTIINSDSNTFTYVNKFGAHVPYEVRYPPSAEIFKPAIRPGDGLTYVNNNQKNLKTGKRQMLLNTYYNAIHWSVDGFFEKLIPLLQGKNVLIIYCSDHGESLMDNDEPNYVGHGQDIHPSSAQAAIPMLVMPFGNARDLLNGLDSNYACNQNHASAYQIFPTLLMFMGYEHMDILENYGLTLFDRVDSVKRRFESGIILSAQNEHVNNFNFTDTLK